MKTIKSKKRFLIFDKPTRKDRVALKNALKGEKKCKSA
jgi:hypothetical protein